MAFQNLGKGALRVAKSYTKGYSSTQVKARNATCNDQNAPTEPELSELAQMTYNQNDFVEILEVLDKRLNDKGKNWRHVFKSLIVLDYLLHYGSENVISYCEDNLYEIKTLREFQYVDEYSVDHGVNVRHKASEITNLLLDRARLKRERQSKTHGRSRSEVTPSNYAPYERSAHRPTRSHGDEEDRDLQRAIEESKRTAEQERAKTDEERDLERALKLSEEDEEQRKRMLLETNASSLFDDTNQQQPAVLQTNAFTGMNSSLPLQYTQTGVQPQFAPLQPQLTAMPSQFSPLQQQFTAVQPQFTSIQPQFTSYNPYLIQAQQEALQAEYLRQQAEWQQQQQQQQLQQQQYQQVLAAQQMAAAQQPLVPQHTAAIRSNNPFAPVASGSSPPQSPASHSPSVSFNLPGTYDGRPRPASHGSPLARPESPYSAPSSSSPPPAPARTAATDRANERLAALFANYTGDGIDTFGNTGQLRFGQTDLGRLAAQRTGHHTHNPFVQEEERGGRLIDI